MTNKTHITIYPWSPYRYQHKKSTNNKCKLRISQDDMVEAYSIQQTSELFNFKLIGKVLDCEVEVKIYEGSELIDTLIVKVLEANPKDAKLKMLPREVDEFVTGHFQGAFDFQFELKTSDGKYKIPINAFNYHYSTDRDDYFKVKAEATSSQVKFFVKEIKHMSKKTKFKFSIAGLEKELIFR